MTRFRRSGTVILLAALAAPVWGVPLRPSSLTIGRALILLATALLALDWHSAPRPHARVPRAVWLLVLGIAAIWAWTAANATVWGCATCGGDLYSLSELAVLCVLTAVICALEPGVRSALVLAVLAAGALEAALALAGVHGLTPGTVDTSSVQGRLAGTFGNPNELGLALAFAVPAGLAMLRIQPARRRPAIIAALLLIVVALVLTLSRSGMLAAAAGGAIVIVLSQPPRSGRRRGVIAGLVVAAVAIGIGYPLFSDLRQHAESPPIDPALRARDNSGWDGTRLGMVVVGGAGLANPATGELEVRTPRAGQGVSHEIGAATARGRYAVTFEARAVSGSHQLGYGLQDGLALNGPVAGQATVSERWRQLHVRWRPTGDSPYASLYVWSPAASVGFLLRDVKVAARPPGAPATARFTLNTKLKGSVYAQLLAQRHSFQQRDINSRWFAVDTSVSAFATEPLRGIGWDRFVDYSSTHGSYGHLPTHDEYLRFLAELGAIGVLLLGLVAAAIARAAWDGARDELGLAVLAMLITGAVALLFINGLVAPNVMMPLAFAAALACGRAGVRAPAIAREAAPWWPAYFGPRAPTGPWWPKHSDPPARPGPWQPGHLGPGARPRPWRPVIRPQLTLPSPSDWPLAWRALRAAAPPLPAATHLQAPVIARPATTAREATPRPHIALPSPDWRRAQRALPDITLRSPDWSRARQKLPRITLPSPDWTRVRHKLPHIALPSPDWTRVRQKLPHIPLPSARWTRAWQALRAAAPPLPAPTPTPLRTAAIAPLTLTAPKSIPRPRITLPSPDWSRTRQVLPHIPLPSPDWTRAWRALRSAAPPLPAPQHAPAIARAQQALQHITPPSPDWTGVWRALRAAAPPLPAPTHQHAPAIAPHAGSSRKLPARQRGPAPAQSASPPSGYRPALDGLRAVAVLAVIGYHMTSAIPGGFLGVDVFFVLSGYLITSILLREQLGLGRIRLTEFWARRARRLLPAVLLLVLVCALEVSRYEDVSTWALRRSDLLSTLFYFANWHFIATDQSYFATFLGASPVRHTWTLAIEEQFYLAWPLVVFGAYRLARGPRLLMGAIAVGIVASAIAMALLYHATDPSRSYFGTDTRANTLLIGAALALLVQYRPDWLTGARSRALTRWAWAPVAIAMLAAFALATDHSALYYQGGAAAFAVLVVLGLFVLEAAPASPLAGALSIAPIRWIGQISYGLYLWYWPVIVWVGGSLPNHGPLTKLLELAVMFAAATTSYYVVERPIRGGRLPGVGLSRRRLAVAMPIALAVVAVATVHLTTLGSASVTAQLAPDKPLACPQPTVLAEPYSWCARRIGKPGAPVVASIGDSTSQALYPGMREAAKQRGWTYIEAAEGGCSILPLLFVDADTPQYVAKAERCVAINRQVLASVQARYRPDVWVLTDRWPLVTMVTHAGTPLAPTDPRRNRPIETALRSLLRHLTADGARVLFVPTPPPGEPVSCALHKLAATICDSASYTARDPATAELTNTVRSVVAGLRRVTLVSVDDFLCPGDGQCPAVINGTVVRYDGVHYSGAYSLKLVPMILNRAQRLGLTFARRRR